jgi:hypothetical protein
MTRPDLLLKRLQRRYSAHQLCIPTKLILFKREMGKQIHIYYDKSYLKASKDAVFLQITSSPFLSVV